MTCRTHFSGFGERGRLARGFRPPAENIPGLRGAPHHDCRLRQRKCDSVALVITLLMLSVITFLAVAFLAVSRRDRSAVTASLDVSGSRAMSDAALARAQAEIVAQMMAHLYANNYEYLNYDYMVSRNYISPFGFNIGSKDTTNVNYDVLSTGARFNMANFTAAWVQNIADLYYDPRPPVFVVTNPVFYPTNSDFRFWVDVNRNGKFETNGYIATMNDNNTHTSSNFWYGEPEWIGVLRDPFSRHSATNQFVGRYAYMVLPIGKTLDLNYIHNWAKGNYVNTVRTLTNNFPPGSGQETDGFARDQGVGSWELNLAGLLDVLSPWNYQNPTNQYYAANPYAYYPPAGANAKGPNTGYAFADAEAILHYRYFPQPLLGFNLATLYENLPYFNTNNNGIDLYCLTAPTTTNYPFDPPPDVNSHYVATATKPWPGSYSTNMFYDPQDLWDTNKTSYNFTNRLLAAEMRTNSFDRYTFQRLLQSIGTSSAPEYGVWVNDGNGNPTLRTKVNINWDNTAQIQKNAVYGPMPTNLVNWTPLGFFTNAAELLLRSQTFIYTNVLTKGTLVAMTNYFGVTNIPIYSSYYNGIRYDAQVHRMLQLAANIYEATAGSIASNYDNNVPGNAAAPHPPTVYFPHVYRPLFNVVITNIGGIIMTNVYITNYTIVTNTGQNSWLSQIQNRPFRLVSDPTLASDLARNQSDNIVGIPWIVGAVKGLPSFNRVSYENRIVLTRKVLFIRPTTGSASSTNQFYVMSVSNLFGVDAWNPYHTNFVYPVYIGVSNYMTLIVSNNFNYGFSNNFSLVLPGLFTNILNPAVYPYGWPGTPINSNPNHYSNSFVSLLQTVTTPLSGGYYSDASATFYSFTNLLTFLGGYNGGFLPRDLNQTHWPVHNWTVTVSNRLVYFMFDANYHLLDFVNLGPFGTTTNFTQAIFQNSQGLGGFVSGGNPWDPTYGTDFGTRMSQGLINQINAAVSADPKLYASLTPPYTNGYPDLVLGLTATSPSNVVSQTASWVANDPLVHYTIDDLTWPASDETVTAVEVPSVYTVISNLSTKVGMESHRYDPWQTPFVGQTVLPQTDGIMLFKDPLIYGPDNWQFPTNKFPSVGWLGRVHRGTPWQTVYLKADDPTQTANWPLWANDSLGSMYPTNDWALVDLFTAAPNDNAARGLLSVNQTNDPAWAALLSGVIAPTNANGGMPIDPTNVYEFLWGYTNSAVPTQYAAFSNAINGVRLAQTNGVFHKVGEILGAATLTTQSPYLDTPAKQYSDEVVERIPQQILGLLKVGEPQFVIYAWGESLKPKNLYSPNIPLANLNICTNYEITGEFLSRTVCHVVHTNGLPKFVIDSYNIEPAN